MSTTSTTALYKYRRPLEATAIGALVGMVAGMLVLAIIGFLFVGILLPIGLGIIPGSIQDQARIIAGVITVLVSQPFLFQPTIGLATGAVIGLIGALLGRRTRAIVGRAAVGGIVGGTIWLVAAYTDRLPNLSELAILAALGSAVAWADVVVRGIIGAVTSLMRRGRPPQ
jgi:hypothetical protein